MPNLGGDQSCDNVDPSSDYILQGNVSPKRKDKDNFTLRSPKQPCPSLVTSGRDSLRILRPRPPLEKFQIDDSALSHTTHVEHEVTPLELLSDLVIVVAIHIVASAIEDEETYMKDGNLVWYCIHCCHLWLVWHYSMITFHISHLFNDTDNSAHFILVFGWMVNVILLAQSYITSDNSHALMIFMILRILETGTFYIQVRRRCPTWFSRKRLELLKMHSLHMIPWLFLSETLPLSLAIYFKGENGPRLALVLFSLVMIFGHRTFGAWTRDQRQKELVPGQEHIMVYDEGLLKERYELMAIIFIGEICFAAAGPSDLVVQTATLSVSTVLALMSAFGCFMLIFTARNTHNRVSFWERSELLQSMGEHTWALLFLVIPCIGAGYLQVMEAIGELEEEEGRRLNKDYDDENTCDPASSDLLNVSSSAFQLVSCLLNFLAIENEQTIRMRLRTRMSIRIFFALASSALIVMPDYLLCVGKMPVAAVVSPVFLVLSAAIEIFGLQSKGGDPAAYFKNNGFKFHVQAAGKIMTTLHCCSDYVASTDNSHGPDREGMEIITDHVLS